jgi:hypothetical protein
MWASYLFYGYDHSGEGFFASWIDDGKFGAKVIKNRAVRMNQHERGEVDLTAVYPNKPRVSAAMKWTPLACVHSLISSCLLRGTPERMTT